MASIQVIADGVAKVDTSVDVANNCLNNVVTVASDAHQTKVATDIYRQEIRCEKAMQMRDDIREMSKVMIEGINSHLYIGSFMLGICFVTIIEGKPPMDTNRMVMGAWMLFGFWSMSMMLLSLWLALSFLVQVNTAARERLLRKYRFNLLDESVVRNMGGQNILNAFAMISKVAWNTTYEYLYNPGNPVVAPKGMIESQLRVKPRSVSGGPPLDLATVHKGLHAWQHVDGVGYETPTILDMPMYLVGETLIRFPWLFDGYEQTTFRVPGEATLYLSAQCPPLGGGTKGEGAQVAPTDQGFRRVFGVAVQDWPENELPLVITGFHKDWAGSSGFGELQRVEGASFSLSVNCLETPVYKIVLAHPGASGYTTVVLKWRFKDHCEAPVIVLRAGHVHCIEEYWPMAEFTDDIGNIIPYQHYSYRYMVRGVINLLLCSWVLYVARTWPAGTRSMWWLEGALMIIVFATAAVYICFSPMYDILPYRTLTMPTINKKSDPEAMAFPAMTAHSKDWETSAAGKRARRGKRRMDLTEREAEVSAEAVDTAWRRTRHWEITHTPGRRGAVDAGHSSASFTNDSFTTSPLAVCSNNNNLGTNRTSIEIARDPGPDAAQARPAELPVDRHNANPGLAASAWRGGLDSAGATTRDDMARAADVAYTGVPQAPVEFSHAATAVDITAPITSQTSRAVQTSRLRRAASSFISIIARCLPHWFGTWLCGRAPSTMMPDSKAMRALDRFTVVLDIIFWASMACLAFSPIADWSAPSGDTTFARRLSPLDISRAPAPLAWTRWDIAAWPAPLLPTAAALTDDGALHIAVKRMLWTVRCADGGYATTTARTIGVPSPLRCQFRSPAMMPEAIQGLGAAANGTFMAIGDNAVHEADDSSLPANASDAPGLLGLLSAAARQLPTSVVSTHEMGSVGAAAINTAVNATAGRGWVIAFAGDGCVRLAALTAGGDARGRLRQLVRTGLDGNVSALHLSSDVRSEEVILWAGAAGSIVAFSVPSGQTLGSFKAPRIADAVQPRARPPPTLRGEHHGSERAAVLEADRLEIAALAGNASHLVVVMADRMGHGAVFSAPLPDLVEATLPAEL